MGSLSGRNIALLCILLIETSSTWSQIGVRISETLDRMPLEQRSALQLKLQSQQDALQREVRLQRASLDTARASQGNDPTAKDYVILLREQELRRTQKTLSAVETAKVLANGVQVSDGLSPLLYDVHESIVASSNPMLPLCGENVSYRGDGANISWQKLIDDFLNRHGQLLPAVGRIEIEIERYRQGPGQPEKYSFREVVGTAFAISPNRIMTAGHVAAMFHDAHTNKWKDTVVGVSFFTGGEHQHNCPQADQRAVRTRLSRVVEVKYVPNLPIKQSPHDYAILEVEQGQPLLTHHLTLATKPAKANAFVLVIAYPDVDNRVDRQIWTSMMNVPIAGGSMFPVVRIKRLAPGTVQPPCSNGSDLHMPHDASTLNRSSGGPIIDAVSGEVVAIQVSGYRELGGGEALCNLGLRSEAISQATLSN